MGENTISELDILKIMMEHNQTNAEVQRKMADDISMIRNVLSEASIKFVNIQEKVGILEGKIESMEDHLHSCPARQAHNAASLSSKALNVWISILVGLTSLGSTVTLVIMWLKQKG